jgi:hypothetical protein
MDEVARLLVLLALAGGGLTLLGGVFVWSHDEARRIGRSLKKVLGAEPQATLIAFGRGKGIGLDLARGLVAVTWDRGAWCLVYGLDELTGVELIVDDQVAARAHRSGGGRQLDQLAGAEDEVRLRFVFDDPTAPDFELELWGAEDEGRRGRLTAPEALREASRWMARMEAVLRRQPPRRTAAVAPPPEPPMFDHDEDDLAEALP